MTLKWTVTLILALIAAPAPAADRPNVVIVYADDLGYGDLGCYGHPTIRTPNLDRMASEGLRFTSFYAGAEVCTPSRAALLTGRYAVRSGMAGARRVLFPDSSLGLPPEEVTIAEAVRAKGYRTGCFGKWHLGHTPDFLPTAHGFDEYFGIPYSNDMDRTADAGPASSLAPAIDWFNVPLMRGTEVIERPADQTTLTRRYTDEAIRFIRTNKNEPFFVYLPHTFPHVPLFRSGAFADRSERGLYGDVVEELDAEVGRLLDALRAENLDKRTLVVFTSDNGPWLTQSTAGGSAGQLRDGKGSTWEGGLRVPAIAWWPGTVRPGVTSKIACAMDLFPTALALAGAELPKDRVIDGTSLLPLLKGSGPGRDDFLYYRGRDLMAARLGDFKAHFATQPGYGKGPRQPHTPPLLYNLAHDPAERFNVAADHPEVLSRINTLVEAHKKNLTLPEDRTKPVLPKR